MFSCTCLCICAYVFVYAWECIHVFMQVHICWYMHTCAYMYIHTWVYVYLCIYIHVHIHMCVCVCMHVFHEKDTISLGSWLLPTIIFLSLWRNIFLSKNLSCSSFLIDWKISKPKSILLKTLVRRKTRQKPEDDSQDTSHYYFLGLPRPVSWPCSLV